jgi:hypothetical protein
LEQANQHLHSVLYGLMRWLLETTFRKPLHEIEQLRILVTETRKPTEIGLPMFIDIGR